MISVLINGTERVGYIKKGSLSIENVLTRQVDRCSFDIVYYSSPFDYNPTIGHEVIIYDGATKIFGGMIVKISQNAEENVITFRIECQDYTRFLDRKLVIDNYSQMTVNAIIADFFSTYGLTDQGFTSVNVDCSLVVNSIVFNYVNMTQCLTTLADLVGYDWYVDYDKDLHFFAKDDVAAPFDVTDTNGNLINASLLIRKDNSQVRNVIYIRGGEYLGDTFTSVYVSNGQQFVYPLGYKYEDLTLTVTGSSWDVGLEPAYNPALYDAMWNKDARVLKFRVDRIPNNTSDIRVGGRPYLPVVAKVRDTVGVAAMKATEGGTGEYEFVIVDKSISTKQAARERAQAEIDAYASSLSEGEFSTYTAGLKSGMKILINSTVHGINEYYLINRVRSEMFSNDEMVYSISLVTFRTMGIIDVLQKLLGQEKSKIEINSNEIVDVAESAYETITLSETFTSSIDHNMKTESMNMAETTTAQSLNYDVDFVLGEFDPILDAGLPDTSLQGYWRFQDDFMGAMTAENSIQDVNGDINNPVYRYNSERLYYSAFTGNGNVFVKDEGGVYDYGNNDDYSINFIFNTAVGQEQSMTEHFEGETGVFPWAITGPLADGSIEFAIKKPYQAITVVDSYSEAYQDSGIQFGTSPFYYGQSFYNANAIDLYSCKFYIKRVGNPTGDLTAYLYAHTGTYGSNGVPTGSPLATSNTILASSLTTLYQLKEFTFSGANKVTLSATTNYVIVLKHVNSSGGNVVVVGCDSSTLTHGGNQCQSDDGSTWFPESGIDVIFYVYGADLFAAVAADASYSDGADHVLCAVRDDTNGLVSLYIDGALKASTLVGSGLDVSSLINGFCIGNRSTLNTNPFSGKITAYRLYDKALTDLEVKELYHTHKRQFVLDGSELG